jgi:hypothetical protein
VEDAAYLAAKTGGTRERHVLALESRAAQHLAQCHHSRSSGTNAGINIDVQR